MKIMIFLKFIITGEFIIFSHLIDIVGFLFLTHMHFITDEFNHSTVSMHNFSFLFLDKSLSQENMLYLSIYFSCIRLLYVTVDNENHNLVSLSINTKYKVHVLLTKMETFSSENKHFSQQPFRIKKAKISII